MKKISLLLMFVMVFVSCHKKTEVVAGQPVQKEEVVSAKTMQAPSSSNVDATKKYTAVIKTSKGDITIKLFPKEAPMSVTNFMMLAEKKFYDGLTFHRVVPDFVIQGGDPTGTGTGGPGYTIPAELGLAHAEGALAWARLPDTVNPEKRSSGSQFYICQKATPFLDGEYSVFGQTISGMEVVHQIQQGDVIQSIVVKVE